MVNRTQFLVLGFFALAGISLVVLLFVSPTISEAALKLPADRHPLAGLAFVVAVSALIAFLSIGVLRR